MPFQSHEDKQVAIQTIERLKPGQLGTQRSFMGSIPVCAFGHIYHALRGAPESIVRQTSVTIPKVTPMSVYGWKTSDPITATSVQAITQEYVSAFPSGHPDGALASHIGLELCEAKDIMKANDNSPNESDRKLNVLKVLADIPVRS